MGKNNKQMKGGGASSYSGLFHAPYINNAELSRYTLSHINNAPIFNPFSNNTVIPTGTSGIIPTGAYYDAVSPLVVQNTVGPVTGLYGGGKSANTKTSNQWIEHVKSCAIKRNMSFPDAMKDIRTRQEYQKIKKM